MNTFLTTRFRFAPSQVAAVERGEAVAVVLPSSVDREVTVGGVVRVKAPARTLVPLIEDIESFERGEGFLATRRLSDPPSIEDFASFELPAEDVAALRTCRPGKCAVKLGKGAFDRLASVNWKAPDAAEQVTRLARTTAVDYVKAYQEGGNRELAIYVDSSRPQFIAQEFEDMVRRTEALPDALPDLSRYLIEYPARKPQEAREFFYWSLADFGLKPVMRLNHVVIVETGQPAGTQYAIATKQLYASHYFHTALEVRAAVDDPERPGRGFYLVTLNMARSDGLTGMFGGLVKSKVRKGSVEGLRRALAATRDMCERAAR